MAHDKDRKMHPAAETTFNGNWAFIWYNNGVANRCDGFAYVWSSDILNVNWTYNPPNISPPTLQYTDVDSGK